MTSTNTTLAATRLMSEFASTTTSADVPADVRTASETGVADVIGSVIGGSCDSAVDRVAAALVACGLDGDIGVLGRRESLSPYASAMLTGAAAMVGGRAVAEPGIAVVAAALVVAQASGASGEAVVTAVAVGTEVASRIGAALGVVHPGRGWDVSGTLGVVGAAAAAGSLARLSSAHMHHALALAATQAAGHRAQAGTTTASLHAGKAAADGIEAVHLAAHGLQGPDAALEGRRGLAVLMADGIDGDELCSGLGTRWSRGYLGSSGPVPPEENLRHEFFTRVEPVLGTGAAALWAHVHEFGGLGNTAALSALCRPARTEYSDKRLVD